MTWLKNVGSGFFPEPFQGPSDSRWSPWLLAAVAAVIAALLLPRQTPFAYQYRTGQPWSYRSLQAPFDYEVLYPEDQVQAEIDKVNAEHGPYFLQNNELPRRQKKRFAELVEEQAKISRHDPQFEDLVANPGSYVAFGQAMLDKIYSVGIISSENEGFLRDDPSLAGFVAAGNSTRRVPLGNLFTINKAREFLSDSLPFSPLRQPEMLMPILEKVLIPNLFYSDSLTRIAKRQKLAAVLSTGIVVRKGETVVSHEEIITPEIAQKLDSLALRYEQPKGWTLLLGYGLLAFLAFAAFFLWLGQSMPEIWAKREILLLLPATALGAMLLVNISQQFAAAAPLLLPLAALPLLLKRWVALPAGAAVWALAVLLTAFALDWGAGWLAIQSAELAALLFLRNARYWQGMALMGLALTVSGTLAWLAAWFSGRLPQALRAPDVVLFILLSAVLAVFISLFGKKEAAS